MKKQLVLIVLATIFLTLVMWKGLQYFQGNDLTNIGSHERHEVEKRYDSLNQAFKAVDDVYGYKFSVTTESNSLYKLKNKHYIVAHQVTGQRRNTQYALNSYIDMDEQGRSELKVGDHFPVSIKKGDSFKLKEWKDITPFGKVYYQSGVIGNNDNFEDVILSDDKSEHRYIVTPETTEHVIKMDRSGHWLDSANFTIGYKHKMKSYPDEQAAAAAAVKNIDTPGQQMDIIRTDQAAYYLFKHRYGAVDEWTVLPVIFNGTNVKAGKYHRYSFLKDEIINTQFKDAIEGVDYKLVFERNVEHPKHYQHAATHGGLKIAIVD